jgi:hypothetical protein
MLARKVLALLISAVIVFTSLVNPAIAASQSASSIPESTINNELKPASQPVKDSVIINEKLKTLIKQADESNPVTPATTQTPGVDSANTSNNIENKTVSPDLK